MNKNEWEKQDKTPGTKVYACGIGGFPTEYQIESVIACGATLKKELQDGRIEETFCKYQQIMTPESYEAWKDRQRKEGRFFERTCKICGKHFETMSRTSTTCSEECANENKRQAARRNPKKGKSIYLDGSPRAGTWKRTCIVCGKPFIANEPRTQICSDTCRKARRKEQYKERRDTHPKGAKP